MTTAFISNAFLDLVAPYAPGAGNLMIAQEVKFGARRFLKDTHLAWLDIGPQSFNALESTFAPALPAGMAICGSENMRWMGSRITERTREILNQSSTDWTQDSSDAPTHYLFDDEATLRIYPAPVGAVTDALTGRLFLRPAMSAVSIDDRIFDHYGQAIAAAALSNLLAMTGKPWSDLTRSVYYERIYGEMKGEAKISRSTDFTGADIRVSMRPIA